MVPATSATPTTPSQQQQQQLHTAVVTPEAANKFIPELSPKEKIIKIEKEMAVKLFVARAKKRQEVGPDPTYVYGFKPNCQREKERIIKEMEVKYGLEPDVRRGKRVAAHIAPSKLEKNQQWKACCHLALLTSS